MAYQEKRARIMLVIVVIILALYFTFISRMTLDPISLTVFALAGFLGLWRSKGRHGEILYDERDRQIERRALVASMCVFYALVLAVMLAVNFTRGWDISVSLQTVIGIFWTLSLVTWAINSLIVIAMYHRRFHA